MTANILLQRRKALFPMASGILLSLLALSGSALALGQQDVLFYAPFDGTVVPAVAAGTKSPTIFGKPTFIAGKRGRAVVCGGGEAGFKLSYTTANNVRPDRGTLAVWVSPVDWHSGDGKNHNFITLRGEPTSLLYTYLALPTYYLQSTPDNRNPHVGSDVKWQEGKWHQLAITWQEGEFCLYVDGVLKGRDTSTMSLPKKLGSLFDVGSNNFGCQDHTAFDDLVILRRALTPEEIEALYRFDLTPTGSGAVPNFTRVPAFKADLRHFPTAGRVEITVRLSGAGLPEGASLRVLADLLSAGNKSLTQASAEAVLGRPTLITFNVKQLPPGAYRVRLHVDGQAGQPDTVELPFERRPRPVWLGNHIGEEDEVPIPWTPVQTEAKRDGQQVSCWGRQYLFQQTLCDQITTQAEPLLAAEMRLKLRQDGQKAALHAGTPQVVETRHQKIVLTNSGQLGNLTLKTRTSVEFDGFTWFEVDLSPPAGGAEVDSLALEMPFATRHASLFYSGVYYPSLDNGTGAIKPQGFKGAWRNWFWVGDNRGGLEWFAEDNRNWRITRPKEDLTITPGPQQTMVRLNVIDSPGRIARPLHLAFGIQATPVKPPRADRRLWRVIAQRPDGGANKYYMLPPDRHIRGVTLWNEGWTKVWMIPEPRAWAAKYIADQEAKGIRSCMYLAHSTVDPREPWFRYYWEDWRRTPGPPFNPAWLKDPSYHISVGVCSASGYSDYYIWLLDRAIKSVDLHALYFDNSVPGECNNVNHGCGVRMPGVPGKVLGRVPILASREFYKRAYLLMKQHDPTSIIAMHMSGYPLMPLQSFCDIMCDGENFTGYMQVMKNKKGWDNYWHTLPLDVMRAQYSAHWGPDTAFLPEFGRALGKYWYTNDPHVIESVEHLIGLFFLHDSGIWPCWSTCEPYGRFFKAEDRFGWDEKVSFVPYWNLQGLARISTTADLSAARPAEEAQRPGNPALVMSLYRRPGRVMFVPFNNTDQKLTVKISWDAAKLGIGKVTALEDYFRDERFAVTGNSSMISLPRRNFRMLVPVE